MIGVRALRAEFRGANSAVRELEFNVSQTCMSATSSVRILACRLDSAAPDFYVDGGQPCRATVVVGNNHRSDAVGLVVLQTRRGCRRPRIGPHRQAGNPLEKAEDAKVNANVTDDNFGVMPRLARPLSVPRRATGGNIGR